MNRTKRTALTLLALSILATSLFFTSGGDAHAQTLTARTSQQMMVYTSDGVTGYFDEGWWLVTGCINHHDLQAILTSPNTILGIAAGPAILGLLKQAASVWGGIAIAVVIWELTSYDHGRGVCLNMWFRWWPQVYSQ